MSSRNKRRILRYLIIKTAAVRAGIKPGTLLRIRHTYVLNADNVLSSQEMLALLGLNYVILREDAESDLVLFYHPKALSNILARPDVTAFLTQQGYPTGGLNCQFAELAHRCECHDIAHEVGIFIGYPLKDVLGFIHNHAPVQIVGMTCDWKIFGVAEESLHMMQTYRLVEYHAERLYKHYRQVETYLHALTRLGMKINLFNN